MPVPAKIDRCALYPFWQIPDIGVVDVEVMSTLVETDMPHSVNGGSVGVVLVPRREIREFLAVNVQYWAGLETGAEIATPTDAAE